MSEKAHGDEKPRRAVTAVIRAAAMFMSRYIVINNSEQQDDG
jgi:hypothetical protein